MNRNTLLEIVDENSGGLKGLDLMTQVIERVGIEVVNPQTFFDEIEAIIKKEIPELGMLRYVRKISEDMFREKVFVFRKEPVCCQHESTER